MKMHSLDRAIATFIATLAVASAGCAAQAGTDAAKGEKHRGAQSIDCATVHDATGYSHGNPFPITVVDVDENNKPVEVTTASAYRDMQNAAANDGINLVVVSGFRTNEEQQALYDAYLNGTGNLAAAPGYSNHQSGHALDLNTSDGGVYDWLANHAADFGFERTVPSEDWHWEYWGSSYAPACGGATSSPASSSCYSNTLGRDVDLNTCVQSASDSLWYQCTSDGWKSRWDVPDACVAEFPL